MAVVSLQQLSAFKAMQDGFAQRGLDLAAILADVGFDLSTDEPVAAERLADLFSVAWSTAVARTGDPAIGLALCPRQPLIALGALSSLIVAAPDLRSGLERMARHAGLISPTTSMRVETPSPAGDTREHAHACRITLLIAAGTLPVPPQRYDFMAATLLKGMFWLLGDKVTPLCVHHPAAAPADPAPWEAAFGCPVHFGAAAFVIELPMAALEQPFPTADPGVGELCERRVAQLATEQAEFVTARVREALMHLLAQGEPRRERVAATLCMSERALQRRLAEEGASFVELVDETRRELARRFLADGASTPTQISGALGFSDPSNFHRACRRWFGRTPDTQRCAA